MFIAVFLEEDQTVAYVCDTPKWSNLLTRIENATDPQFCIEDIGNTLGIKFVAYRLATNSNASLRSYYVKTTFPAELVRLYLVRYYHVIDPITEWALTKDAPQFWHQLDWSKPVLAPLLEGIAKYGISETGYVIPIKDGKGRRALMNFSSPLPREKWIEKINILSDVLNECARLVHETAISEFYGKESFPSLSPREQQCLFWAAKGKDAGSIGIILGISVHTVRDYFKSAKQKLGADTLGQAIHQATLYNILGNK